MGQRKGEKIKSEVVLATILLRNLMISGYDASLVGSSR